MYTFVINVAGYGAYLFEGTDEEAEEARKAKAQWEQGAAFLRPAMASEIVSGTPSSCFNHPGFKHVQKDMIFACNCPDCLKMKGEQND